MTCEENFRRVLVTARRRRWAQGVAAHAVWGLAVGSGLALVATVVCVVSETGQVEALTAGLIVSSMLIGTGVGVARRPSLSETARAIDQRGRLKDRMLSALEFAESGTRDEYHRLQLRDAAARLESQIFPALFPWRWTRTTTWAASSLVAALVLALLAPDPPRVEATLTEPPRAVVAEAEALNGDVEQFEELAEELDSEEMKDLSHQLRAMLEAMAKESRTEEDAMVRLARMTKRVEHAMTQFDPTLLERQLEEMGEGMKALDGFRPTAEHLDQADYDRAGKALDTFGQQIGERAEMMPSSGGLVDIRVGQLAGQMGQAGLRELSEALSELQKAISKGSRKECQSALSRLGNVVRKYGRRVRAGRAMRGMMQRLRQCKSCMSRYCKGCRSGGKCQGGGCRGAGLNPGLASLGTFESKKGSQQAGTAAAMNLFGKETELRAGREQAHVSAHAEGAGPSEIDVERSVEARQQAARGYRSVYAKYRKISDAVMTEEAIPLGHRHLIRRYFERIHPSRIDASDLETQVRDVGGQDKPPQPLRDSQ